MGKPSSIWKTFRCLSVLILFWKKKKKGGDGELLDAIISEFPSDVVLVQEFFSLQSFLPGATYSSKAT